MFTHVYEPSGVVGHSKTPTGPFHSILAFPAHRGSVKVSQSRVEVSQSRVEVSQSRYGTQLLSGQSTRVLGAPWYCTRTKAARLTLYHESPK